MLLNSPGKKQLLKRWRFTNIFTKTELQILFMIIEWRVWLFFVAFVAMALIQYFHASYPHWQLLLFTGFPHWFWAWGGFDGVHYLTIAKQAYAANNTEAFFPMYPILIKICSFIFFNNYFLAALFVSNVSFIIFLFLFKRLLDVDNVSPQNVFFIVSITLLFPFSFYFGTIYNESFFMVCVIGAFLCARKKLWFYAGILGFLASATRLVGIFLMPSLILEYMYQQRWKLNFSREIAYLLLIPGGLLLYMVYLQLFHGDFLYFVHVQPSFGAERTAGQIVLLPQVLWRYLKIFSAVSWNSYTFWVAVWEMTTVTFIFSILLLNWKKIRPSYLLFSLLALILPTLTGTLSSMPRYSLVAFPVFMVLGSLKSTMIKTMLAGVFFLLLCLFTVLFTRGYWVS